MSTSKPVRRGVRRAELAHAEGGGHVRGEEARAHGDRLVGVQMGVQRAPAKRVRQRLFDERHARRAADHLHNLHVLESDVIVREEIDDGLERRDGAVEKTHPGGELLELRALDGGAEIHVLVHPLHGEGRLLVRREDLLRLAHLLAQLAIALGASETETLGLRLASNSAAKWSTRSMSMSSPPQPHPTSPPSLRTVRGFSSCPLPWPSKVLYRTSPAPTEVEPMS